MYRPAKFTYDRITPSSLPTLLFILILSKCDSSDFLFIGYSLRDPDIKNILVQVRSTLKGNPRTHLLIMKKVEDDNKLQRLWAEDLRRYGIFVIFIDDYDEINNYLNIIERKLINKYIYVSGSHTETKNQEYYCKFGMKLAEKGYTLLYPNFESSNLPENRWL